MLLLRDYHYYYYRRKNYLTLFEGEDSTIYSKAQYSKTLLPTCALQQEI